jgi:hypothetical protein
MTGMVECKDEEGRTLLDLDGSNCIETGESVSSRESSSVYIRATHSGTALDLAGGSDAPLHRHHHR